MALAWYSGEVVGILDETPLVKRFFVELKDTEGYDFIAGQFASLDLPISDEPRKRRRSYSIASAPDGGKVLEFAIVYLEGGLGTNYLFNELKLGDKITVSSPQGRLILPDETADTEFCFISTGTGLSPFRSMLLDLKATGKPFKRITNIFGTRLQKDILYRQDMEEMAAEMPNVDYHVALSREKDPDWKGYRGYVHKVYEDLYPEHREDVIFYLCGWKNMIDEARKRLTDMGYDRKQVKFEVYG